MRLARVLVTLAGLTASAALAVQNNEPTRTHVLYTGATKQCGQWDSVETENYTIYNNVWGKDSGKGLQCLTVDGLSDGLVKWSTAWSWSGGQSNVKSYPNIVLKAPAFTASAVKSIRSKWQWDYSGSNVVANVAYNLLSSSDCGSTPEYEIEIWLGALGGARPISSTGSPNTTLEVGGILFDLYKGLNGQVAVFSFIATKPQKNYSGNIHDFIKYLFYSQGYPITQCVYSISAGTEVFTGKNAKFTTMGYNVSISASDSGDSCAPQWGQCGGNGWPGPMCCSIGTCKYINEWHSQCLV